MVPQMFGIPENLRRSSSAGLMLGRRRRRRASIEPELGQHLFFAGMSVKTNALV